MPVLPRYLHPYHKELTPDAYNIAAIPSHPQTLKNPGSNQHNQFGSFGEQARKTPQKYQNYYC